MSAWLKLLTVSLKELGRDRTSLGFILILPVLLVLFFGFAYGASGTKMIVGVSPATGAGTARVVSALKGDAGLTVETGSLNGEMSRLNEGAVDAVIKAGAGSPVRVFFAQGSGSVALAARSLRNQATAAIAGLPGARSASGVHAAGRSSNPQLDFVIPGILAVAVMWLGIFAALPFVTERTAGASPLRGDASAAQQARDCSGQRAVTCEHLPGGVCSRGRPTAVRRPPGWQWGIFHGRWADDSRRPGSDGGALLRGDRLCDRGLQLDSTRSPRLGAACQYAHAAPRGSIHSDCRHAGSPGSRDRGPATDLFR